jgi:hypothetical protein
LAAPEAIVLPAFVKGLGQLAVLGSRSEPGTLWPTMARRFQELMATMAKITAA